MTSPALRQQSQGLSPGWLLSNGVSWKRGHLGSDNKDLNPSSTASRVTLKNYYCTLVSSSVKREKCCII